MPIDVEKEVTTTTADKDAAQVSQTSTSAKVPTGGEVKEAKADRNNAWIWYIIGLIDLLLALRLVFNLFGARSVGFAEVVYGVTDFLVAPFRGIFPIPQVGGSYFDTATLVAIVLYALLGWAVSRLVDLSTRPDSSKKI